MGAREQAENSATLAYAAGCADLCVFANVYWCTNRAQRFALFETMQHTSPIASRPGYQERRNLTASACFAFVATRVQSGEASVVACVYAWV